MTHPTLLCANWKMNPPPDGFDERPSPYRSVTGLDVWVFPTYLDLYATIEADVHSGGQAGHPNDTGTHTGSISMRMLKDAGCVAVLCGHSERRNEFGETDDFIREQVEAAVDVGLVPVLCIGETLEERNNGKEQDVVREQLKDMPTKNIVIAYEPVWAVGTGKTATPQQAQEMHAFIRSLLPKADQADMRILYGGSVTPDTTAELLSQKDVDGLLVGSSSLKPDTWQTMIDIAKKS